MGNVRKVTIKYKERAEILVTSEKNYYCDCMLARILTSINWNVNLAFENNMNNKYNL